LTQGEGNLISFLEGKSRKIDIVIGKKRQGGRRSRDL